MLSLPEFQYLSKSKYNIFPGGCGGRRNINSMNLRTFLSPWLRAYPNISTSSTAKDYCECFGCFKGKYDFIVKFIIILSNRGTACNLDSLS